jgi:hypothetical protein
MERGFALQEQLLPPWLFGHIHAAKNGILVDPGKIGKKSKRIISLCRDGFQHAALCRYSAHFLPKLEPP